MGVKGSCRSANRGGCPFLYALYISSRLSFASASWLLRRSQGQKGIESGQKGSKVNIYLLDFVSLREFRRQQTAKFKIYLNFEGAGASVVALSLGRWWCPLVACGALPPLSLGVFRPFLPAFALFPAFLSCFAFQICPYLAFLGGFWRVLGCGCMFVWVEVFALIVGLLCAWEVRRFYVLWRVCPYFFLFSSSSHIFWGFAFVVLGLSSWLLGFCSWSCPLSLCGLLFLFPFRTMRKKKGRTVLVRPRLSCYVYFPFRFI